MHLKMGKKSMRACQNSRIYKKVFVVLFCLSVVAFCCTSLFAVVVLFVNLFVAFLDRLLVTGDNVVVIVVTVSWEVQKRKVWVLQDSLNFKLKSSS